MAPSCPAPECQSWQSGPRRGRLDKETFGFLLPEIFRRQRFELRSWQREPRSRGGGACSDVGSELRQVVNAELLFDTGHFIDHSLKTIFAEKFVLFFLKIFSERVVLILAHDLAELGKRIVSSRASCGLYMRMNC